MNTIKEKKLSLSLVIVLLFGALLPQSVFAGQDKVSVCHLNILGEYDLIEIADPALDAHLAHGDVVVGDGFDESCTPIVHVLVPSEELIPLLDLSTEPFEADTGIEVIYEYYFDPAEIYELANEGNLPDMALLINPNVANDLAAQGHTVNLLEWFTKSYLRRQYHQDLLNMLTVDNMMSGFWYMTNIKDLVWYQPDSFASEGYAIPQTFNELISLSDAMVAGGFNPWCMYMESGFATGWMATDWIEHLLLRAEGPAVYDDWVSHVVLFTDPRIETAFERFQAILDSPGYVFDRANVLNVGFNFNVFPLGEGDCLLHVQGDFFKFFIDEFGLNRDAFDVFHLPPIDPASENPIHMAGLVFTAFHDRPDAQALTAFLTTGESVRPLIEAGYIAPHKDASMDWYPSVLDRKIAEIFHNGDVYRQDASDLMPPEVGTGFFWTGMVDLIAGLKTIPEILSDIDASWPS